jgi:hypothetical protein
MSGAPRVSVLVKCHNHRLYVEEAIRSVLAQGFHDFELLVLDDASSDGSPDIVRSIDDARIDLRVSDANAGPSMTLKRLLERAAGDYVAILNSDDFALPGRLERQVAYLDRNRAAAAVFSNALVVDESGRALPRRGDFEAPVSWPDHGRPRWLRHFFFKGNCLCAPSAMLRRDVLLTTGLPDPRFTNLHDLDLWVRLAAHHEIGFIPEPLTAFRVRAGDRNLSAPRPDTQLRVQFETAIILHHYARMAPALIGDIFAPELDGHGLDGEAEARRFVARMALTVPLPSHRLFALQTLFETAGDSADYEDLRRLTGQIDVFNFLASPANPGNRSFGARLRRFLRRGSRRA